MEDQQKAVVENLFWFLDNKKETAVHYKVKLAMYEDGYEKGSIATHVYTVTNNLRKWKEAGIKIFFLSNAWVQTQKLFISKTNHGELSSTIDGFFGTDLGNLQDPATYSKLIAEIGMSPSDVIFLTKRMDQEKAAKEVGVHSVLVISHSHQLKRYDKEDLKTFEHIRSFDEIKFKCEEDETPPAEASPDADRDETPETITPASSPDEVSSPSDSPDNWRVTGLQPQAFTTFTADFKLN